MAIVHRVMAVEINNKFEEEKREYFNKGETDCLK